jgi:pantoate--beta-alanine ligase
MKAQPTMNKLRVVAASAELRVQIARWRQNGDTIGFVPTMGALHDGHMSLIALARARTTHAVASVFVNPKQFAPGEDFASYPRRFEDDFEKLDRAGAELVYRPDVEDLYPPGFATSVAVGGPARVGLEDKFRPSHFEGVATVVAKLLLLVHPHVAVFGEKDYQQLAVVRRLVGDLGIDTEIVAAPTLREPDGLAMSSRNAYLTADERRRAPTLYGALGEVASMMANGRSSEQALGEGRRRLAAAGFEVDYLELRDAVSLEEPAQGGRNGLRLLAAARIGRTRLIDNIAIEAPRGI